MEAAASSPTVVSIESFSYRWLINLKSSSFDHHDYLSLEEASFIVMDPKTTRASKRFFLERDYSHTTQADSDEFNFPTYPNLNPTSHGFNTATTLVYAEELFSNGLIMPLFLNNNDDPLSLKSDTSMNIPLDSVSTSSDDVLESSTIALSTITSTILVGKKHWKSLPKGFLKKYLGFLGPICQKVQRFPLRRFSRTRNGTVDARRRAYTPISGLCDFEEGSIREAVLHCKKSIGKADADHLGNFTGQAIS